VLPCVGITHCNQPSAVPEMERGVKLLVSFEAGLMFTTLLPESSLSETNEKFAIKKRRFAIATSGFS